MQMSTMVRMMFCIAFATFFLLGVATGQTSLQISSCLTKEKTLWLSCSFTPASDPKLSKTCYYMTENKLIGSTNTSSTPDSTFKNHANVSISNTTCELYLDRFSADKPQNYTCYIKQTTIPVSTYATLDISKLQTCSAWCVVQHSGAALLLAFLTFPLLSELL